MISLLATLVEYRAVGLCNYRVIFFYKTFRLPFLIVYDYYFHCKKIVFVFFHFDLNVDYRFRNLVVLNTTFDFSTDFFFSRVLTRFQIDSETNFKLWFILVPWCGGGWRFINMFKSPSSIHIGTPLVSVNFRLSLTDAI